MAKAKAPQKPTQPALVQRGRKGGYLSDKNMNFGKSQSIEELTGGRIKKKGW